MKDKFLIRYYLLLLFVFLILYYVGESRTREFENNGFELCEKNGLVIWSLSCPEKQKWW